MTLTLTLTLIPTLTLTLTLTLIPTAPLTQAQQRTGATDAEEAVLEPPMFGRGQPPVCSCLVAFRRTPRVRQHGQSAVLVVPELTAAPRPRADLPGS